jgi:hypothetical protein
MIGRTIVADIGFFARSFCGMIFLPLPRNLFQVYGLELLPKLSQHLPTVLQFGHHNVLLVCCFDFFVPFENVSENSSKIKIMTTHNGFPLCFSFCSSARSKESRCSRCFSNLEDN